MIQHVTVETPHEHGEACVRFWALLGFEEVEPPGELGERSRWVQRAGTQIHLQWIDDPVIPPSGHVAVVAEDYDATLERLRDAGFDPEDRPQHWGVPRCFVRDPAGHRVEIMSAPPS